MLQSLDTIIAFITIMTLCSVLVMILVQMVSALFSLRGKNLANALALTLQKIDPTIGNEAHRLAQRILSDPLLSDSVMQKKSAGHASDAAATSDATEGSARPWASWHLGGGAMDLANAIRPEEIYAALKALCGSSRPTDIAAPTPAPQGEAAPPATDPAATDARPGSAPPSLQDAAARILKALRRPSAAAMAAKAQWTEMAAMVVRETDPALKAELAKRAAEMTSAWMEEANRDLEHLETWFNAAQDRAQQWFRMHLRGITIAVSCLFALVCQIDAGEVFRFVSSSPAARDALVRASEQVLREADGVLDDDGGLPRRVETAWNRAFPALAVTVAREARHVADVRAAARKNLTREHVANILAEAPPLAAGESASAAAAEVQQRLAAFAADFDPATFPFEREFDRIESDATQAYFQAQGAKLRSLQGVAGAVGFSILPEHGWRWPVDGDWTAQVGVVARHLPGIALFAGLLTLGAPFWFNVLRNLSSLRPALAQVIGDEQKAAGAPK